jgi:hypothetical protein
MLEHWKLFEGAPNGRRREKARITLGQKKAFMLNRYAYEALGAPSAVELLFDEHRDMIGIRPCDPRKQNAFPIKSVRNGSHKHIHAGAFLMHFAVSVTRRILFEEIDFSKDGMLILDLHKITYISRGSR